MRLLYFKPTKSSPKTSSSFYFLPEERIASLLQRCTRKPELTQIQARCIRSGLMEDTFLASRIVSFLASSQQPDMPHARKVFDDIPQPTPFLWNSIIRGYVRCNAPAEALLLFRLFVSGGGGGGGGGGSSSSPDSRTFAAASSACARLRDRRAGTAVHGMAWKRGFDSDVFVMSGILNFYSCCRDIVSARDVFDGMPELDVVSWTSMASGYALSDRWDEAFRLLDKMKAAGVEPNEATFASLISACGLSRAVDRCRGLHSRVVDSNMVGSKVVADSLIGMYGRCRSILGAVEVFEEMPVRDTVTWNLLLGGYVRCGMHEEALAAFGAMRSSDVIPDKVSITCALSASAQLGDLLQGKLVHAYIDDRKMPCDISLSNALLNMYAKCGDLEKAASMFREMPEVDVFTWTALISGYVHGNRPKEALDLFEDMRLSSVEPNAVTLVCLLSACTRLGALEQGKLIHSYIEEHRVERDTALGNALVAMYAKCGCLEDASASFHEIPRKDALSWNTIIFSLASHGRGDEALSLFREMERDSNVKPDHATLTAVLWACSHSGLVDEGFSYFNSMTDSYGVVPSIEHYGCMVDLLSRAGLIDEAVSFINKMPIAPNSVIWGSLLSACQAERDVAVGERVANLIVESEPRDEGAHVLVSNLYAGAGRWEDVRSVRALMGDRGIAKSPGCSSIELDGVVHEFSIADRLLLFQEQMLLVLDRLSLHSKLTLDGLGH